MSNSFVFHLRSSLFILPLPSVIEQYTTIVKPMHEQFVEPSKKYADIIVPEGGYNHVALNMIIEKIRSII